MYVLLSCSSVRYHCSTAVVVSSQAIRVTVGCPTLSVRPRAWYSASYWLQPELPFTWFEPNDASTKTEDGTRTITPSCA